MKNTLWDNLRCALPLNSWTLVNLPQRPVSGRSGIGWLFCSEDHRNSALHGVEASDG
jgi:hypothetical protein